jgi:hypothetical protein
MGNKELYLRFYMSHLRQFSDEEILTHRLCAPMEILFKHSRDSVLELPIYSYQNVFEICVNTLGDDYLFSMLKYIDSIKNIEVGKRLHKFVEEVFKNKNDIIITYGELLGQKFKQEGIEKGIGIGMEKGILIKAIAVAKNMLLKLKIGPSPSEGYRTSQS